MRFNLEHYSKVWRGHPKKEAYCFPLKMFLGTNGLFENHELKGCTFIKKSNGEKYTVDDVYVHWWEGWYFVALAVNTKGSHASITWNINSKLTDWSINKYEHI
jgi:hypothetical protein